MIDQIYLMLYNLLFTSLPPLAIGVYDKTVSEDLLLLRPYLYRHVSVKICHSKSEFTIVNLVWTILTPTSNLSCRAGSDWHINRILFG